MIALLGQLGGHVTLLTGGLGYIGSHVAEVIVAGGDRVVIADDLSTGRLERAAGAALLEGDVADPNRIGELARFMQEHQVTSVIHLAGRKNAPESVTRPAWYFQQNVGGLACVLEAMAEAEVTNLVFSSSAAVYGPTAGVPVTEDHHIDPANPYGITKAVGEQLIQAAVAQGLRATSLRYFNVLGASSALRAEKDGNNLVPLVLAALTRGEPATVFGNEHHTADGTCVRDYVHVADLAQAHVSALAAVAGNSPVAPAYNIGTGTGYSVLDVLAELEAVLERPVNRVIHPARAGDPEDVVADVDLARADLGWTAQRDLTAMLREAIAFGPASWRELRAVSSEHVTC